MVGTNKTRSYIAYPFQWWIPCKTAVHASCHRPARRPARCSDPHQRMGVAEMFCFAVKSLHSTGPVVTTRCETKVPRREKSMPGHCCCVPPPTVIRIESCAERRCLRREMRPDVSISLGWTRGSAQGSATIQHHQGVWRGTKKLRGNTCACLVCV